MSFDVITFGEAMIRLAPPQNRRLEQARSLDVQVGGAELNTAVAVARLGHKSAWVSRLTNNPLGKLIANHAREAGVSTEHVLWTNDDRAGLYFLEFGAAPRASSVLYDRKDSAIAKVKPGKINWSTIFQNAKWFHFSGITPALSPSAAEVTREALQAAKAAKVTVSVDLNYRAKLWSQEEANKCMTDLMQFCDVLITTEEDTKRVFDISGENYESVAEQCAKKFPLKTVAITLRENPFVWRNQWTAIAWQNGKVFKTRTYEVEVVDRLGAGDSFSAGFIHGLLEKNTQMGLDYGVAASAIKHSIPGDFAWITRQEVEALMAGPGLRISR